MNINKISISGATLSLIGGGLAVTIAVCDFAGLFPRLSTADAVALMAAGLASLGVTVHISGK